MRHANWTLEEIENQGRMETLGKITAGIVHDFNNILGAISGFAELIIEDMEKVSGFSHSKTALEYARNILNAGEVAQTTIRELQKLARPGKRKPETLQLNNLVSRAISLLSSSIQPNIKIAMELRAKNSCILGLSGPLQNAIFNLVLNARDAMPTGGRITVRTWSENSNEVSLSVQDTGCGIPKKHLDSIFDPFFTTKGQKGNGLGLANVLATVESHSGTIAVTSHENIGTEFILRFPIVDVSLTSFGVTHGRINRAI